MIAMRRFMRAGAQTAMGRRGSGILKASLSALHFSGIDTLLKPLTRGTGAVFMLHHVLPATPLAFAPNRHLEVTPEFLDRVIRLVIARGFDIISLDDARARLREGELDHPFVCFTFDDGYRDTLHHAYPIFKRHGLPFAVYVASDFADGRGDLWWLALEQLLRQVDAIELKIAGDMKRFSCRRPSEKMRAYRAIYRWLQQLPEVDARGVVADLCRAYELDVSGLCRELVMNWDDVRDLARDPLVTIGAHSRSHLPLSQLSYADVAVRDRAERRADRARDRPPVPAFQLPLARRRRRRTARVRTRRTRPALRPPSPRAAACCGRIMGWRWRRCRGSPSAASCRSRAT